jgi:hypothetical protein
VRYALDPVKAASPLARTLRLSSLACVLVGASAWAQDPYEIQVYAADILVPGTAGLELHVNHARASSSDYATHLTLEPHLGLASWCEAGLYLTSVITPDGHYGFSGVKARFKAGLPQRVHGLVGLALNTELAFGGAAPGEGMGLELRPIVDLDLPWAYLAFNPIFTVDFAGPTALGFEPALKANVKLSELVQVGVEYYGGLELAPGPTPLAHRLFSVVDVEWRMGSVAISLDAGIGYGLAGPEKVLVKTILGLDFL